MRFTLVIFDRHHDILGGRNIAWFNSLHSVLKLTNVNMENHMILVKERTAICSQLMSTQETVFPCDDMQRSNTQSRGFPLDKKDSKEGKSLQ